MEVEEMLEKIRKDYQAIMKVYNSKTVQEKKDYDNQIIIPIKTALAKQVEVIAKIKTVLTLE